MLTNQTNQQSPIAQTFMGLSYTRTVLASESESEAQAPQSHGTQSKERLAQSITEVESLRQTIKLHEAYHSLTKRLLSLKSALDDVRRDVRHRNFCRTSHRQGEVLLTLFNGIRRHAATTRALFTKCLESARRPQNTQEHAVVTRMLGENVLLSQSSQLHAEESLEVLALVDRGEYFDTKDDAEILFAHHANDVALYSQFLKVLDEFEKRGKRKRKGSMTTPVTGRQRDTGQFGVRGSVQPQQHMTTFGPAIELRALDTSFMEKIFPRKDDYDAIKFWVAVVGDKVCTIWFSFSAHWHVCVCVCSIHMRICMCSMRVICTCIQCMYAYVCYLYVLCCIVLCTLLPLCLYVWMVHICVHSFIFITIFVYHDTVYLCISPRCMLQRDLHFCKELGHVVCLIQYRRMNGQMSSFMS